MLYLMGWYFLFAAPLVLICLTLAALVSPFTESFETSMGVASLVMSPLSIWFLVWQFFYFVGPAYIDILRSVGFFLHRAQSLPPTSAIAMVKQRRRHASQQFSNLLNWLSLLFRRGRS